MEEELERDDEFLGVEGEASGPLLTPSIEEQEPVDMNPNLVGIPQRFPEGSGIVAEQEREDAAQMQLKQVWRDTLDQSAVNSVIEYFQASPEAVSELFSSGKAELEPYRAELTDGIPLHLHDQVMGSLTLSGARARADRIREDQRVQARLAQQVGISRGAVQLAGGLLDADLPLIFASGGTIAAGRTALTVARTTRALTGSTALSRVTGDFAVGLSGGALSGAIVGGVGMAVRDDYDVQTMFNMVLASAATGGALNPIVGRVLPDRDVWERAAELEVQDAVNAVQRELHQAKGNPDHPLNLNEPPVDDLPRSGPVMFEVAEDGSVNAASLGTAPTGFDVPGEIAKVQAYRSWKPTSGTPKPQLDPWTKQLLEQGASESEIAMSLYNREHLRDIGYQKLLEEDMQNPLVRLLVGGSDLTVKVAKKEIPVGQALGTFFTMGNREFTTLVHSKAPSAQWVASEILSSSSGLGRNGTTAAALKDMYFYSARTQLADVFSKRRSEYYSGNRSKISQMYKNDGQFSAAARLAMDAHRQGKNVPAEWKEFVEAVDRMNDDLFRRMQENDVLGTAGIKTDPGYFRYDIVPEKVLDAVRKTSENAVVKAFAKAYRKRNPKLTKRLATRLAKASVRRRLNQARGVDAADRNRQTRAVGSAVEQVLIDEGVGKADREAIMKLLGKQEEGRATASFLRDRVEFDMETQIGSSGYRMVDLFSDDIESSMLRYAHEAAGSAALASKGLKSTKDVDDLVNLIGREATATGDTIDPERIRGLFSQFTGGTHVGVDPLTGNTTQGVSGAVSALTSATRSSLLQRLGLTTIMDAANTVASNGFARSLGAAIDRLNMGDMSKVRVQAIEKGLSDIRFLTGQDHLVYRSHLAIEENNLDRMNWGMSTLNGLRSIENATYYVSGHHNMLSFLQRVSADATFSNLVAGLNREAGGMTKRQMRDMGLTEATRAELYGLIQSGDINLTRGSERVNLSGLSKDAQDELATGMHVVVNQQMQRGQIGETSMWMNSDVGKILSALKTFGIMATQKQLARRLMTGGKADVAMAAMWQIGFAYAVLSASHAIQGTNMDTLDRARLAVVYSPVLGVGPTTVDPVMTMLGFDDLNFSPYGRYSSPLNSPVIETAEKLSKSPGAVLDMLSGEGSYNDMQNARAMFFLNWYGMKRLWEEM